MMITFQKSKMPEWEVQVADMKTTTSNPLQKLSIYIHPSKCEHTVRPMCGAVNNRDNNRDIPKTNAKFMNIHAF
jgi:hypothetical protein